jgi:hypothetical protein
MKRFRDSDPTFAECFQMRLYRFAYQSLHFLAIRTDGNTTGQVWHRSSPGGGTLFVDHGISNTHFVSNPESFRIVFRVPVGTSSPDFPATVTNFGLTECLKIRWLPAVRTCRHPSNSSNRTRSLTFMILLSAFHGKYGRAPAAAFMRSQFSARKRSMDHQSSQSKFGIFDFV